MDNHPNVQGSNQYKKTLKSVSFQKKTESEVFLTTNPYMTLGPEIVQSRRLLLQVLALLKEQSEALTVLGAHAVFEQTKSIIDLPAMDSTHDADVGVAPELLLPAPLLTEVMDAAGLEPANPDRPGIWGLKSEHGMPIEQRLTIDLIAPAAVAGPGSRSARVGNHGRRSVSKAVGTELTLIDRQWMTIESFDDQQPNGEGYVAGVAALVCAKVYKIFDRTHPDVLARNPKRYRTKDVTDLFRLMVAKDGREVRAVFDQGAANSTISETVIEGQRRLFELRDKDDGHWIADQVILQWGDDVITTDQAQRRIDQWFAAFGA